MKLYEYMIVEDKGVIAVFNEDDEVIFNLPSQRKEMLSYSLEQGGKKNELVHCLGNRGWGFTENLIKFAKQHRYAVIGGYLKDFKKELRLKYDYNHIYRDIDDILNTGTYYGKDVVVDTCGVYYDTIAKKGYNIVTGFKEI